MAAPEASHLIALVLAAIALTAAAYYYNPFPQPGQAWQPGDPTPSPTAFFSPTPGNEPAATPISSPSPTPEFPPEPTPSRTPTPEPAQLSPPAPEDILGLEIHFDKATYHPMEKLNIQVRVNASRALSNVDFAVFGVRSVRGYDYVENRMPVSLIEGANEFNSSFTLPSCSSCSGVGFGEHNITASLYCNGELLRTATEKIEMAPTPVP